MSPESLHTLLRRELVRLGLDESASPSDADWRKLLVRVSRSYSNVERQVPFNRMDPTLTDSVLKSKEQSDLSEAHLRAVLDTVGEGILTIRQNGRIMHANTEVRAIWGYSEDELRDMEAVTLLRETHRSDIRNGLRQFNRFGSKGYLEKRHILFGKKKSGEVFPVEVKVAETRVGGMVFFTAAIHDISRRVSTQNQLMAQMRRNEVILQQAMDGFYMQSLQGRLVEVNQRLCTMRGCDRKELLRSSVFDIYDMDPRDMVEILDDIKSSGEKRFESKLRRMQGKSIKVEVSAHYGLFEGEEFYSVFLRDLTEGELAKEREDELQAKLARSERMESLGVLAGGVAHDLNNILGPLVAYPELILEDIPEGSDVVEMVHDLGESARRAAAVIQDLLALARRGNYTKVPVNLNEVVQQHLESPAFRSTRERSPMVAVEAKLDADLLSILGTTPHLLQVVMNLVANAIEAIDGAGRTRVETFSCYMDRPVRGYDTIEVGDYAVLRVSDTGSGIAEEELERIFEPFYTRKLMGCSGTGLGLAVVYGVVKDLDGYIDVKSVVGKGTEFLLYFPVTRESVEQETDDFFSLHGSEEILVVDDVPEQRKLASRLLMSIGYEVASVSSGEEALEYLSKHKVDLVVLDMIMEGGIDGLVTLERIRESNPDQRCIIASGFAETDRVKRALHLGIGDYVLKPYTLEKIGYAVRRELDRIDEAEVSLTETNVQR